MSAADEPRPERGEGSEPDEQPIDAERSEAPPPGEERDAEERFEEEEEEPVLDEVDVRELLRGALRTPEAPRRDLLLGVQARLRQRSRGKFYADGWSTSRAPRSLYLTTSILMLALIAFVFLVLIPWGGGAVP